MELEAPAASEPGQTPPALEDEATAPPPEAAHANKGISPWLLFGIVASLTLLGTALTVITKLMTIPMANYPLALTFETVLAVRKKPGGQRSILIIPSIARSTTDLHPPTHSHPYTTVRAHCDALCAGAVGHRDARPSIPPLPLEGTVHIQRIHVCDLNQKAGSPGRADVKIRCRR